MLSGTRGPGPEADGTGSGGAREAEGRGTKGPGRLEPARPGVLGPAGGKGRRWALPVGAREADALSVSLVQAELRPGFLRGGRRWCSVAGVGATQAGPAEGPEPGWRTHRGLPQMS